MWWKYNVRMFVNGKMRLVESIPRMGEKGKRRMIERMK
jgi:hypothetical protein